MKSKIITLLMAALFCLNFQLSAQKIKNEKFDIAYTQLPPKPLYNEFTTYKVNFYGSGYVN